jgi:predicted RND superfamily exporter protein
MHAFEARLAQLVLDNRLLVISISLVLVGLLSYGCVKLLPDTSYKAYFSKDNPELIAFEKIEDTYTKNDNVIFVLAPKNQDVFTGETLSIVEELTIDSWQMPFSTRVDSITNFQFTEAMEDDLIVRDMAKNSHSLTTAEIQKIRQRVLAEPLLINQLVSESGHVTGVNITLTIPPAELTAATPEIAAFARELQEKIEKNHPQMEVYLSGMIMMDDAFNQSAINDFTKLLPVSFAVMMLLLAFLVGRFFGTLATFIIIVFSILSALGVGGYLGYPLTGSSPSTPIIILTVAIANCVHVLTTYAHSLRNGAQQKDAMHDSLKVNLQPIFLASVTTAIGFLTMNFSEVPPFNHLGTLVAVGVLISFLLSISFLPALVTLLPKSNIKLSDNDGESLIRFANFVIANKKA